MRNWWVLVAVAGWLLCGRAAPAAVQTYPGPAGIDASDQYAVEVRQAGRARDSFVYLTRAQWRSNRSKTTSWTTFSFSGPVTVKVTKLQGTFSTCKVLPSRLAIVPRREGDAVLIDLDRPRKISVEFDGDTTHPMLVFADPLETDVPEERDPGVVYFGPGVHRLREPLEVRSGQTVYLAGGAYVLGRIAGRDTTGATIRGRGVLSGEEFAPRSDHLVRLTGWKTRGAVVEGITVVASPHFNLVMEGGGNTARNLKMISWYFSTDGVSTGRDGLVEGCFFKVNDDALKLYFSGMTVHDCVIWQMENGAPFQISWNMPGRQHGFHIRNVDVIRVEHRWDNKNEAVFDAIHGGSGQMSDYLFEEIRIENAHWRLFYLTVQRNEFADPKGELGSISNLVFRNITVDGPMTRPNVIRGAGPAHRVAGVTFENVRVDGKAYTSPEDGNFEIDPDSTRDIRFVAAPNTSPP